MKEHHFSLSASGGLATRTAIGASYSSEETWKRCYERSGRRGSQKMDERVERAVLFMENNCQRKLHLRQIAAGVGMSRSRLSALLLAHLDVSPMRLLKTIRMQHARALLQSSSLSVK